MVQVQTVNRQAVAQFANFEAALFGATNALEEMRKVARSIREPKTKATYSVATKEDVLKSISQAETEIDTLKKAAKHYKSELLARGWRV